MIVVQFAALLRCLGEYFRLEYFAHRNLSVGHVEPFIVGASVCAAFVFAGVLFYFGECYKTTVGIAALNVGILMILRFTLL